MDSEQLEESSSDVCVCVGSTLRLRLKDDSSAAVWIRLSTEHALNAAVFTHIAAARKRKKSEMHIH